MLHISNCNTSALNTECPPSDIKFYPEQPKLWKIQTYERSRGSWWAWRSSGSRRSLKECNKLTWINISLREKKERKKSHLYHNNFFLSDILLRIKIHLAIYIPQDQSKWQYLMSCMLQDDKFSQDICWKQVHTYDYAHFICLPMKAFKNRE